MNKFRNLLLSAFCIFQVQCRPNGPQIELFVKNQSNLDITVVDSNTLSLTQQNNVGYYIRDDIFIARKGRKDLWRRGGSDAWREYIRAGANKKLILYIFDLDLVKHFPTDMSINELISEHKYLKVLEFSEQQLDQLNWNVTFVK